METHQFSHHYTVEGSLLEEFQDANILEKAVLFLFMFLIVLIFFISLWSSILLVTGNTQGGGPLGMLANIIINLLT